MKIRFQVQRHSSERGPWTETYELEAQPNTTVLDCLNRIKWEQDGSLAFRKNCRNTICGSCAIRMDGRAVLACQQTLQGTLDRRERLEPSLATTELTLQIQPLGNLPVIKDLVVDMGEFWQNLAQVDPYVSTASRSMAQKEFLQSPQERSALNQVGNCILCGACYSECNAKSVTPEFVGPHALAKAYRVLADTRDSATQDRLTQYAQDLSGVWGCTRCFNCNSACPMEVAPLDQITRIKTQILAQPSEPETRPIRHRKAMIDLVAQGGWVDERRFGLQVVGNRFRDLKGMFSLLPLGLNMILHRKFPKTFEASEGTLTVRSLIRSITMRESSPRKPQP
ncbi:MAG: succinate dehydrogenase/fumarate reductase iron-sulfur subunit [Thermosynechococcaceae cyanobacterium]